MDKACSQNDMAYMTYGHFKGFPRRTSTNKVLCDETINIAKCQKYDAY